MTKFDQMDNPIEIAFENNCLLLRKTGAVRIAIRKEIQNPETAPSICYLAIPENPVAKKPVSNTPRLAITNTLKNGFGLQ
jgi:hypothetical protein